MELTIGGWIFLVVVWGIVGGLCAFCMYRIFFVKRPTSPGQQNGEAT